jgi:hypothetical protein
LGRLVGLWVALKNDSGLLWIPGTERPLRYERRYRGASVGRLWTARSANEEDDVVLKCFPQSRNFKIEQNAYLLLRNAFAPVEHYIGDSIYLGHPTIVQKLLQRTEWNEKTRLHLFEAAISLRNSLRRLTYNFLPTAAQSIQALFAPLREWLSRQGHDRLKVQLEENVQVNSDRLEWSHGDFHPPNLMTASGGELRLIDWERAAMLPTEWDYAALTVGVALRSPREALPNLLSVVAPAIKNRDVFNLCAMCEMLELTDIFLEPDPLLYRVRQMLADSVTNAWLA